jgi:hypothetical protein
MKSLLRVAVIAGACGLAACSVWPVNQDPDGVADRQNANHIIWALQAYHQAHGQFPAKLVDLVPTYMHQIPDVPQLRYHPDNGSLSYRYIPSWPQLRWTWCDSVDNTTEWRCKEHLL